MGEVLPFVLKPTRTCRVCVGTGSIPSSYTQKTVCPRCHGRGRYSIAPMQLTPQADLLTDNSTEGTT